MKFVVDLKKFEKLLIFIKALLKLQKLLKFFESVKIIRNVFCSFFSRKNLILFLYLRSFFCIQTLANLQKFYVTHFWHFSIIFCFTITRKFSAFSEFKRERALGNYEIFMQTYNISIFFLTL